MRLCFAASFVLFGCNPFTAAPVDDAGVPPATKAPADAADAAPACVHERIDLSQVTITPDNTFVGDGSGVGSVITTDAGIVAEADAGQKNVVGLVLTARGFVRRLGFAARTAKIRFETKTTFITSNAVLGCWIIHVDSKGNLDLSQQAFNYGGYLQSHDGDQSLRARAPLAFQEIDHAFAPGRPVDAPAQIVRLESTRDDNSVTYTGSIELADGGLIAPDGGAITLGGLTLEGLPTEIVCGVSVAKQDAAVRAGARWVEIDACP